VADSAAPDVSIGEREVLAEIGVGDLVRARRTLWRVDALRRRDPVAFVTLHPDAATDRAGRTLVAPFDAITRARGGGTLAPVSRRRAMRHLASLVTAAAPFDVPSTLAAAPVRLLPFQIEPLLCLRSGLAARVLIADRVGLGKTVQAALIARDLLARRRDAAVLILAPAGLRDQWIAELRDRAGLRAWLVDADTLRARAASLPPHVNPWQSASIVVSSIDFVKQADVRRGLDRLHWDLLVVDEAHTLTRGTDRLAAADALAQRSDRVVLLTATPHDGRDEAFRALCALGRIARADVLAVFRRERSVAGPSHRRVTRRLRVRPRDAELRLHALLERYAQCVWRVEGTVDRGPARLAMAVLFKRAASSAASLAHSLERRRLLLAQDSASTSPRPTQAPLPLEADNAEDAAPEHLLAAPGLEPAHERTWLNLLVHAAWTAARDEAKLGALRRLIRRMREPIIVFTEYRDTLTRLDTVLRADAPTATIHGGCTAEARRAALRAFETGAARVLLATDAASEGLNLQARCRFVVHVELPWSPTRIEQRIGRVDRLGQTRTVHSLHLVAGAVEASIEARLAERLRRVHAALDATGDADNATQTTWLGAALASEASLSPRPPARRGPGEVGRGDGWGEGQMWPDLRHDAERVASWLERMRALTDQRTRTKRRRGSASRPLVARIRARQRRRSALARGALYVYRARVTRPDGALIEHTPIAVRLDHAIVDTATRRAADDFAAQLIARRAITLASTLEQAETLVHLRHAHALTILRRGTQQTQLTLFPEMGSGVFSDDLEKRLPTPFPPHEIEKRLPTPFPTPLVGAAQLAAVLIVE
jgi:superfamily II DNA or RNA helicase